MKNKVCIIGVYFGKLPKYFSLWLKSAEYNHTVDFWIFTDQLLGDLPDNIKCVSMDLNAMQSRATKLLGFEANLSKPYKCCDYKPLYGLLFADYVSEYDYWGHCDFDLIFGDLQYFFDLYKLYDYDRFLALGHLSLYRNTDEVNNRYICEGSTPDYKTVFQSDLAYVFDEMPGMTALYLHNKFPFFYKNIFADIACTFDRFRIIENYSLDEKVKNYKHQIFSWEKGKIYRHYYCEGKMHREERIYIHFKKRPNFEVDFAPDDCSSFYITKFGFVPKKKATDLDDIKLLNPYKGMLYEKIERSRFLFNKAKAALLRRVRNILK